MNQYSALFYKIEFYFKTRHNHWACTYLSFQMITVYSPLTWGIYTDPPSDIPECGFLGQLCPPVVQGKSSTSRVIMDRFYRAAYMQGGLRDGKGVRPSVCPSVRHTREL